MGWKKWKWLLSLEEKWDFFLHPQFPSEICLWLPWTFSLSSEKASGVEVIVSIVVHTLFFLSRKLLNQSRNPKASFWVASDKKEENKAMSFILKDFTHLHLACQKMLTGWAGTPTVGFNLIFSEYLFIFLNWKNKINKCKYTFPSLNCRMELAWGRVGNRHYQVFVEKEQPFKIHSFSS